MADQRKPFSRYSLAAKAVFMTVLASCAVWVALDLIQSRSLKNVFQQQLAERLGQEALEDRLNFDRYISAHNQLVSMLAMQKQFIDYLESDTWPPQNRVQPTYHKRPPSWLPRLSAFRSFTRPRHVLLIDGTGTVREVFQSGEDSLPDALLRPGGYLLEQSRGQNYLTTVGEIPYLVTSKTVTDSKGNEMATLTLASPFDEQFLIDSQGSYRGRLVGMVMGSGSLIAASSNLDLLPTGTPLSSLEGRYLVTGQEFYEYGDSELAFRFASFISTDEVDALTREIVSRERRQRAVLVFGVILFFTLIITLITRRTERLAHRMIDLSEKAFTQRPGTSEGEDKPLTRHMTLEEKVRNQETRLERAGQLKSFIAPQIAEMLLAGDSAFPLKPHRREVTVVFLDLRGFTSFAEKSEPEEVMSVLRDYHEEMGKLIIEHEGTLEHFAGDGMMIFFNDPVEVPNPSERAVRMAVGMRERIVCLKEKWGSLGYNLDCGFGIAQGYATIGIIGFEGRWDYSAIGTVTNLASRICDEAKGCEILITKKTLHGIKDLVQVVPREPLTMKGLSRPVETFNVMQFTS